MNEIYLSEDRDGGNMAIKDNGDIQNDGSFESLVYHSLFCGETPLNVIREIQYSDSFEKSLDNKITLANMVNSERLGDAQLAWLVETGLATSVKTVLSNVGLEKVKIRVDLEVGDEKYYITFDEFKEGKKVLTIPIDKSIYEAVFDGATSMVAPYQGKVGWGEPWIFECTVNMTGDKGGLIGNVSSNAEFIRLEADRIWWNLGSGAIFPIGRNVIGETVTLRVESTGGNPSTVNTYLNNELLDSTGGYNIRVNSVDLMASDGVYFTGGLRNMWLSESGEMKYNLTPNKNGVLDSVSSSYMEYLGGTPIYRKVKED